ncbi:MAG TPA: hypothetical protein PLG90_09750 [Ignavibacteria bacterium]|nr:hypothetical protein [Ignavibacteria bacterium]
MIEINIFFSGNFRYKYTERRQKNENIVVSIPDREAQLNLPVKMTMLVEITDRISALSNCEFL